ncbi:MAG: HAD family phosphatase [Sedimentisphaerales bacterium]|nr:HAD family phosphatase [Sedimentisphaerales bacterium]
MSMCAGIRAVIFDLGRVVVDIDFSRSMFRLFREFDQPSETIIKTLMTDDLIHQYNTGQILPRQFYDAVRKRFDIDIPFAEFQNLWCDIFSPMPGMESLIQELVGHVKLGLLSNTDPLHWKHIYTNNPIMKVFSKPTLSFEIGMQKPELESFRIAARDVDTPVEYCLYVDDLRENIEAAHTAGMKGLHFINAEQLRKELVVKNIL